MAIVASRWAQQSVVLDVLSPARWWRVFSGAVCSVVSPPPHMTVLRSVLLTDWPCLLYDSRPPSSRPTPSQSQPLSTSSTPPTSAAVLALQISRTLPCSEFSCYPCRSKPRYLEVCTLRLWRRPLSIPVFDGRQIILYITAANSPPAVISSVFFFNAGQAGQPW